MVASSRAEEVAVVPEVPEVAEVSPELPTIEVAEPSPPVEEAPPSKDYSVEEVLSELERATKALKEIHFAADSSFEERKMPVKATKKVKIKKLPREPEVDSEIE
jgi:hypothetical protein